MGSYLSQPIPLDDPYKSLCQELEALKQKSSGPIRDDLERILQRHDKIQPNEFSTMLSELVSLQHELTSRKRSLGGGISEKNPIPPSTLVFQDLETSNANLNLYIQLLHQVEQILATFEEQLTISTENQNLLITALTSLRKKSDAANKVMGQGINVELSS